MAEDKGSATRVLGARQEPWNGVREGETRSHPLGRQGGCATREREPRVPCHSVGSVSHASRASCCQAASLSRLPPPLPFPSLPLPPICAYSPRPAMLFVLTFANPLPASSFPLRPNRSLLSDGLSVRPFDRPSDRHPQG